MHAYKCWFVALVAPLPVAGVLPALCAAEMSPPVISRIIAVDNVCAWPNLTPLRDGTIIATIHNPPNHGTTEGDISCWASPDGAFWEKRGHPAPNDPQTVRMNVAAGLAKDVWSHAKVMGAHYWGSSAAAIRLIAQARARGVNVWTDQYPYNSTGGAGAAVLVPAWAIGDDAFSSARGRPKGPNMDFGYADALRRTMSDPGLATRVQKDVAHEISRRGGAENIVVFDFPDRTLVGQSLEALAKARGLTPVAMALELQFQGFRDRPGGARLRGFSVWEEDVHAIMAQPWTATSTDAGIALPEDGPDVHARFYGSYPRKLHHYALERGIITLEQAIRSSTSLPAQILGLRDRGLIREGLAADIVVFDPKNVRDTATFSEPHRHAQGIEFVLVNGKPVVDATRLTGALAGRVLVPEKARR